MLAYKELLYNKDIELAETRAKLALKNYTVVMLTDRKRTADMDQIKAIMVRFVLNNSKMIF